MTVSQDEKIKAAMHALLLGVTLPIWIYNIARGNRLNKVLYSGVVALEVYHIASHVRKIS